MSVNRADGEISRTLEEYARAVASASPTPGGGSVAANVAAFAAGLCEMVCNLTLTGKAPPTDPDPLRSAALAAENLRERLLALAFADERAYGGYRDAAALPKSTEDEKAARRRALQAALLHAADVPLETARTARDVLRQLEPAAQFGTPHALSDVSTAALLAQAAAISSLFNVRANADLMKDLGLAASYRAQADEIEASAKAQTERVLAAVANRF